MMRLRPGRQLDQSLLLRKHGARHLFLDELELVQDLDHVAFVCFFVGGFDDGGQVISSPMGKSSRQAWRCCFVVGGTSGAGVADIQLLRQF
jgi:hypothetical protein